MSRFDQPACWSWDVPPVKTLEMLLAEPGQPRREPELRFMMRLPGWAEGNRFLEFHADRCAVCGRAGAEVEDHCHDTGQVRGYLCRSCNVLEGRSSEPIFVRYRRRHPAAILAYYCLYDGVGWRQGWSLYVHRADAYDSGPRPFTPWPSSE